MGTLELSAIQNKIYEVRGFKVMLDFDLAEIYTTETRALNQQVRRNIKRFPEDFMFQLTKAEWKKMSSQFVMTSRTKRPKSSLPLAFTEHGVTMSANVLKSDVAIEASILVVRAFVALRQLVTSRPTDAVSRLQNEIMQLKQYIEGAFADCNDINEDTRMQRELINEALAKLQSDHKLMNKPRNPIGFLKPENK
jgi:hypothetical protein